MDGQQEKTYSTIEKVNLQVPNKGTRYGQALAWSILAAEVQMNIYWLQEFWFFPKYYTDTSLHKHYFTIEFPKVNVDAQIWLTIFSPGVNFDKGVTGLAAAGVKSYRFVDQNGAPQYQEPTNWDAHIRIQRCTEITFAFHVQLAWAKAEGIIYWYD